MPAMKSVFVVIAAVEIRRVLALSLPTSPLSSDMTPPSHTKALSVGEPTLGFAGSDLFSIGSTEFNHTYLRRAIVPDRQKRRSHTRCRVALQTPVAPLAVGILRRTRGVPNGRRQPSSERFGQADLAPMSVAAQIEVYADGCGLIVQLGTVSEQYFEAAFGDF